MAIQTVTTTVVLPGPHPDKGGPPMWMSLNAAGPLIAAPTLDPALVDGVDVDMDLSGGRIRALRPELGGSEVRITYQADPDRTERAIKRARVADEGAFRESIAEALTAMDQARTQAAAIDAAPTTDLDTVAKLRGVAKTLARQNAAQATAIRRLIRVVAPLVGDVDVPPE